jgi:hypothetical protein
VKIVAAFEGFEAQKKRTLKIAEVRLYSFLVKPSTGQPRDDSFG